MAALQRHPARPPPVTHTTLHLPPSQIHLLQPPHLQCLTQSSTLHASLPSTPPAPFLAFDYPYSAPHTTLHLSPPSNISLGPPSLPPLTAPGYPQPLPCRLLRATSQPLPRRLPNATSHHSHVVFSALPPTTPMSSSRATPNHSHVVSQCHLSPHPMASPIHHPMSPPHHKAALFD